MIKPQIGMSDIKIKIIDRDGELHEVDAPTDMNMNLMEVVRSYELAPEGTIGICGGMAMCASCQCYVKSDHQLPEKSDDEEAMLAEAFLWRTTAVWVAKSILPRSWTDWKWNWHQRNPKSLLDK